MKWETEKPSATGWYWYNEKSHDPEIVVFDKIRLVMDRMHYGESIPIHLMDGKWAGPIHRPDD